MNRAILGGGRYDDLMADVGGEFLSGVGFVMGDMVISILLEKYKLFPVEIEILLAQILVSLFSEDQISASLSLATELRNSGLNVSCYPEIDKIGKQFKFANRMAIDYVIVLGPDEISNNTVTVKDLKTGDQKIFSRLEVVSAILQMLDAKEPS